MKKQSVKNQTNVTSLNYVRFSIAASNQLFVDSLFNKRIIVNFPERVTKQQLKALIKSGDKHLIKFSCMNGVISTELVNNLFYVGVGAGSCCFICTYEVPVEICNILNTAQFSLLQIKPGELKLEIDFDTLRDIDNYNV